MKYNLSDTIIKVLENESIEIAFGISGSHYLAFYAALKKSQIKFISTKHESSAGFMALNFAKTAQKPALILGTAGPGAMNLLGSIAEMYKANIPCFVLTPIVPTTSIGKNSFQEDSGLGNSYSISKLMSEVCKKSITAVNPNNVPNHIRDLCRLCVQGRRGPVHLLIPTNFFEQKIEFDELEPMNYRVTEEASVVSRNINKLSEDIANSKRPVFLVGHRSGYPDISDVISEISSEFGIPVIVSASSKGLVDEYSDYFGGILDLYGHRSAEVLIKRSDLVITLGEDLGEFTSLKYDPDLFNKESLIQLDTDGYDIGRNYAIKYGFCGDLRTTLGLLLENLKSKVNDKFNDVDEFHKLMVEENRFMIEEAQDQSLPLKPQVILREISDLLPKNSSVFTDIGAIGYFSLRYLKVRKHGYYTSHLNYTLGQSVAGCIGGKLAVKDNLTVCLCGDGAFLMNGMEVATSKQYDIPIIWVIFKDNRYNMVDYAQKLIYGNLEFCTEIYVPNLSKFAEAFGINYFKITDINSLTNSFTSAFNQYIHENQSSIIEIEFNSSEPLPMKPQTVQFIQEIRNMQDFKATPDLMRSFKNALKEKV